MLSKCFGSGSVLRSALFVLFLQSVLPAWAQLRDDFITITEGPDPFHVGVNPVTNRIYIGSWGFNEGIVTVIDGATNGIISTVALESSAEDIVANPVTNLIYVAVFGSQLVAVIDGSDNSVVGTVLVPDFPLSIAVNPVTNRVYSRGEESVSVLDGLTNNVIATVPVDGGPRGLAVDVATNRVFVSDRSSGSVVVIDGDTNTVSDTVLVGGSLYGMDVDPATNRLYVAAGLDVAIIDTITLSVIDTVPVEGDTFAVAVNPSTNRLYVRTEFGGVHVIDTLSNSIVKTFAVSDSDATDADIGVNSVTNAVYVPMAGPDLVWVTEDPAPFGGRDFGIGVVAGGVQLTWTPGATENGYSIIRWAGDGGDTVETIASLAQGTSSFVDRGPLSESAYHYALVPLDDSGNPLWVSDIVGVRPNTQSTEHAPSNFTLRHAAHAHHLGEIGSGVVMTWQEPGDQAGYVLASSSLDSNRETRFPADATCAIQVITEPSCFVVYAGVGEEAGHTHILCAIPLTWAMENDPGLAQKITSRASSAKLIKSATSTTRTTSTKVTTSKKPATLTKPTTSTKRTTSAKPVTPTKVSTSKKSATLTKPTTSTKVTTSKKPATSAKPAISTKPATSPKVTTSKKPAISTKPAKRPTVRVVAKPK